jgi:hypothetical protein
MFNLPNQIQLKTLKSGKTLYLIETYNAISLNAIDKFLNETVSLQGEKYKQ